MTKNTKKKRNPPSPIVATMRSSTLIIHGIIEPVTSRESNSYVKFK